MHCAKHGIAAGPDGLCALCRRLEHSEHQRRARRWAVIAVLALFGLSAVLLSAAPLKRWSAGLFDDQDTIRHEPRAAASGNTPEPSAAARTEPLDTTPLEQRFPPDRALPPPPDSQGDDSAVARTAASVATTLPSVSPPVERPSGAPQATPAEVQAALAATRIVVFTTSWCPQCEKARGFLRENGLQYEERDIERDTRARDELRRRSGKTAVPTFEIDGELLRPGFSRQFLLNTHAKNLERRLGVRGITLR